MERERKKRNTCQPADSAKVDGAAGGGHELVVGREDGHVAHGKAADGDGHQPRLPVCLQLAVAYGMVLHMPIVAQQRVGGQRPCVGREAWEGVRRRKKQCTVKGHMGRDCRPSAGQLPVSGKRASVLRTYSFAKTSSLCRRFHITLRPTSPCRVSSRSKGGAGGSGGAVLCGGKGSGVNGESDRRGGPFPRKAVGLPVRRCL